MPDISLILSSLALLITLSVAVLYIMDSKGIETKNTLKSAISRKSNKNMASISSPNARKETKGIRDSLIT